MSSHKTGPRHISTAVLCFQALTYDIKQQSTSVASFKFKHGGNERSCVWKKITPEWAVETGLNTLLRRFTCPQLNYDPCIDGGCK